MVRNNFRMRTTQTARLNRHLVHVRQDLWEPNCSKRLNPVSERTSAQDLHMGRAETEPFTLPNAAMETRDSKGERLKEVGKFLLGSRAPFQIGRNGRGQSTEPSKLSETTSQTRLSELTNSFCSLLCYKWQRRESARPFRGEHKPF